MGSLEKPRPVPIDEVLRKVHPPRKELEGWRQKELAKSLEQLEKRDSICIVGDLWAGKSFFTVHKLVPALKERGERIAVFDSFLIVSRLPRNLPEDALESENLAAFVPGITNQLRRSHPVADRAAVGWDEASENPIFREFLGHYFCPLRDATVVIIDEAQSFPRVARFRRDAESEILAFLRKLGGKKVVFVGQSDNFEFLSYLRELVEREGTALDLPTPADKQRIIEFV